MAEHHRNEAGVQSKLQIFTSKRIKGLSPETSIELSRVQLARSEGGGKVGSEILVVGRINLHLEAKISIILPLSSFTDKILKMQYLIFQIDIIILDICTKIILLLN